MPESLELSEKARAELKNIFEKYPGLMEDVDKLPEPLRGGVGISFHEAFLKGFGEVKIT